MTVTVTLTTAEADLVRRKSKPFNERPAIYHIGSGTEVTISDDFEAFLILANAGARSSMALMINILLKFTSGPTTRNAAYAEMLNDAVLDALARQAQSKQILSGYDASFQALDPGKFKIVPEVSTMNDDLLALIPLQSFQDFANYQYAVAFQYKQRGAGATDDALVQRMARSYMAALVSYA